MSVNEQEQPGENVEEPTDFAAAIRAARERALEPPDEGEAPERDAVEPEEAEQEEELEPEEIDEEPELEEEEELEPEQEPLEQEAEAEFWAGRYKTREAAEEAMREKDLTIDRLFKEFHRREQEQPVETGPQQLDVNAWNEWAATAVERGMGVQGAMDALREGGTPGYNIYLAHWQQDDPVGALTFNNDVQQQTAVNVALQAVQPLLESQKASESANEAAWARAQMAEKYEDFEDLMPEMDRIVTEVLPEETRASLVKLAAEDVEGKKFAWDFLYQAASAQIAPRRRRAAQQERKQRRASSDQAKIEATVSSAEAAPGSTSLTATETEVIRRKNEFRRRQGLPLLEE